jgi:hypothetical protein
VVKRKQSPQFGRGKKTEEKETSTRIVRKK